MENLSAATGGNFIRGDNDVASVLRRLDSIPEYFYVLGFSPTEAALDGKYHALKIGLKHPRGMTVSSRQGYYAAAEEPDPGALAVREIRRTFFSDQERQELPVTLQVRSSHTPDRTVLTAIARI